GDTWAGAARVHTPITGLHVRASEDALLAHLEPVPNRLLSRLRDFIAPDLDAPTPTWSREFAKWDEWELRMLLVGWLELRSAIRHGIALESEERPDADFVLELDEWFRTFRGFGATTVPRPSSDPRYRSIVGGYDLVMPRVSRAEARRLIRQANGNPVALA